MKVLAVALLAFGCTVLTSGAEFQDKRGTDDYSVSTAKPATASEPVNYSQSKFANPPYTAPKQIAYAPPQQLNYLVQPTYKFGPQQPQAPAQISYLQSQPQQYEAGQQNLIYTQPGLTKLGPALQKVAYSPVQQPAPQAPAPAPTQYSLAGDVSSFKYSSPFVSYSNLGLLSQTSGKLASGNQAAPSQPAAHQASGSPAGPQQLAYAGPQQLIYRPKPQPQPIPYNSAPQQVPKLVYSQAPQLTYNVPQPSVYSPPNQKLSASVPQQFVYNAPQQIAYAPVQQQAYNPQAAAQAHTVPQPVFVLGPQYQPQSAYVQKA